MAILLVEQYFEFAHELADRIVVMDRGQILLDRPVAEVDAAETRRHLTV